MCDLSGLVLLSCCQEQIALHGRPLPASTFVGSFEDGFEGWTSLEGAQEDSIVVRRKQLDKWATSWERVLVEAGSACDILEHSLRPRPFQMAVAFTFVLAFSFCLLPAWFAQLVSSPVRTGNQSVRIRVRPGDYIQHGNRAEITHNLEDSPGTCAFLPSSLPPSLPPSLPLCVEPGVEDTGSLLACLGTHQGLSLSLPPALWVEAHGAWRRLVLLPPSLPPSFPPDSRDGRVVRVVAVHPPRLPHGGGSDPPVADPVPMARSARPGYR
jgi:hypothetical protein